MKNPNRTLLNMDDFAKQKEWRVPSATELEKAWQDVEQNLIKGWSKRKIWELLVPANRFSYNYFTFLRTFPKVVKFREEEKRKAQIEQRKAELAQEKKSEDERVNALFGQYK